MLKNFNIACHFLKQDYIFLLYTCNSSFFENWEHMFQGSLLTFPKYYFDELGVHIYVSMLCLNPEAIPNISFFFIKENHSPSLQTCFFFNERGKDLCVRDIYKRCKGNWENFSFYISSSPLLTSYLVSTLFPYFISFYFPNIFPFSPPDIQWKGLGNTSLLARRSTPSSRAAATGGNVGMVGMRSRATSRVRMSMNVA